MIFLQNRAPAGVVNDDINEDARTEGVCGPGEFAKLIHAGGAPVEFDKRRVNGREVERRIGAAEAPEPREGGRRGMNGQQMENAATELLDDVGQLAGEVAKLAGGWNDGEIFFIERLKPGFEFSVAGGGQIFCRTEQARERAINGVGGAGEIGMDADAGVRALGPMLPAFWVEQIRLGFEEAGFGQWQFDLPGVAIFLHRHVAPGGAGVDRTTGVGGDDFAPESGGATEIGAEQRPPAVAPAAVTQRETHVVADKARQALAGHRFHDGFCLRHFMSGN
jgi:hypothetical protein